MPCSLIIIYVFESFLSAQMPWIFVINWAMKLHQSTCSSNSNGQLVTFLMGSFIFCVIVQCCTVVMLWWTYIGYCQSNEQNKNIIVFWKSYKFWWAFKYKLWKEIFDFDWFLSNCLDFIILLQPSITLLHCTCAIAVTVFSYLVLIGSCCSLQLRVL